MVAEYPAQVCHINESVYENLVRTESRYKLYHQKTVKEMLATRL